jgi:methyl-accepting chemotaxis protein
MKLLTKLLLIASAAIAGMVLIGGIAVTSLRSAMLQERQQSMQMLVKMAASQVEHFQVLEKSGALTREAAQAAAKDVMRSMRDGENYVFVRGGKNLLEMLVHPDPAAEGTGSNGGVLPSGQTVTDAYSEALQKSNPALVSITTKRPDGDALVSKINAIQSVPDWNWVIGSGAYVDDIDRAFTRKAMELVALGGIILVCVFILAFVLTRGILRQLGGEPQDATESMRRIANGDLAEDIQLDENDNTSLMASLSLMQMKLRNITNAIQENASTLEGQARDFASAAKRYGESNVAEDLHNMLRSSQKLWKIADVLGKSVSRFKT